MTLIAIADLVLWLMRHKLASALAIFFSLNLPVLAQDNAPIIALHETGRRLVIIPFTNTTDFKDLDYLQNGIPQFIASEMARFKYIRVQRANREFIINPDNRNVKDLLKNNKYLQGMKALKPDRMERIELQTVFEPLHSKNYNHWKLADIKDQAQKFSADYIVRGSYKLAKNSPGFERYALSGQQLDITVEMFDNIDARMENTNISIKIDNVYKENKAISDLVKKFLVHQLNSTISIKTSQTDALVFIDDLYLGKTPLSLQTIPGSYKLQIYHEDMEKLERTIVLNPNSHLKLDLETRALIQKAGLEIDSNIKGADVYLNMTLIGQTPLKRLDLPAGTHRIRLHKKGYVDRIKGIELKDNQITPLHLDMLPGATQSAFLDPGYKLFDWTTYDLSFYSLIGSFTFYLGYIYFDTQAHQVSQSIRSDVQNLAIWDMLNSFQQNPLLFAYQWNLIQSNQTQVRRLDNYAKVSATIGLSMIVGAVWLFYEAVAQDEKRDTGEVGEFFYRNVFENDSGIMARTQNHVTGSRYEMGINLRF